MLSRWRVENDPDQNWPLGSETRDSFFVVVNVDRWRWLGLAFVSACGFSVNISSDGGGPSEVTPPDIIDAAPQQFMAVVSLDRGGSSFIATRPLDDTGFLAPCAELMVPASRALLSHPTLSYVYSAANGFGGISVGCTAITPAAYTVLGAQRPTQTVVLESSKSIGFFTIDGTGATGIYRFTTSSTGEPTISGPANGPSASGGLALDATSGDLYVTGTNVVWQYKLVGPSLDFPAVGSHVIGVGCGDPVAVFVSGSKVLEFCGDSSEIKRLQRSPFLAETGVTGFGAVDRVVSITGDHVVAARRAPADLVVVDLTNGSPTWGTPVTIASRATALGVSKDGSILVSARQIDASTSELTAWKISSNSLTPLGSSTISGVVTAVTLTTPGT